MGGGGTPAPPAPVAVPSAVDEEASDERARLYSMLRSRRKASLAYGPTRRLSMLRPAAPAAPVSALAALDPLAYFGEGGGGEGMGGDLGGGDFGGETGTGGTTGGSTQGDAGW